MKLLTKFFLFLLVSTNLQAVDQLQSKGVQDILSMTLRSDGQFDVVCLDGVTEVRTSQDISQKQVCTHFSNVNESYVLFHGGVLGGFRFCDMDIEAKLTGEVLWSVALNFSGACSGVSSYFSCSGSSNDCHGTISGANYRVNYSDGLVELENVSASVTGLYHSIDHDRYQDFSSIKTYDQMSNVPHIFSMSDGDFKWSPVCLPSREEASLELAEVVCRQYDKEFSEYKSFDYIVHNNSRNPVSRRCYGYESNLAHCMPEYSLCDSNKIIQVFCK